VPKRIQVNPLGYHFVDFWSQGHNVFKSMLLAIIMSTSGSNARESMLLVIILSTSIANTRKSFKSMLLAIILSISGINAKKHSNLCFFIHILLLLEAISESLQIDAPGSHFVDFWSQCLNVFKSMLLAIILSTSGSNVESLQIDAPGNDFVDF